MLSNKVFVKFYLKINLNKSIKFNPILRNILKSLDKKFKNKEHVKTRQIK